MRGKQFSILVACAHLAARGTNSYDVDPAALRAAMRQDAYDRQFEAECCAIKCADGFDRIEDAAASIREATEADVRIASPLPECPLL